MKIRSVLIMVLSFVAFWANRQSVSACGFCDPTYNYYIFNLYPDSYPQGDPFSLEMMAKEWTKLTHQHITEGDLECLQDIEPEKLDTVKSNPIVVYAREHDKEMFRYIKHLLMFYQLPHIYYNEWEYPTKEDIEYSKKATMELEQKVMGVRSSRFAAQYRLLKMRIYFRASEFDTCVKFWESEKKKVGKSVFDVMAKGLYAGALLRVGKKMEAAVVYAELGDCYSAMFCMNERLNASCMRSVAEADPNSSVLPFMIMTLMNSVQETYDFYNYNSEMKKMRESKGNGTKEAVARVSNAVFVNYEDYDEGYITNANEVTESEWFGMLDNFAVHDNECKVLEELAMQMAKRNDVKDVCMWQTALAYLHYLTGNYKKANEEIEKACGMRGSKVSKENARIIRLLICTTMENKKRMESILCADMPWLIKHCKNNEFNRSALCRIAVHGIVPRYEKMNNQAVALMAWSLSRTYWDDHYFFEERDKRYMVLSNANSVFFRIFEAADVKDQKAMYNMLFNADANRTAWESMLARMTVLDRNEVADIIGTRLLRMGKWADAINWLAKVDISLLKSQHIGAYAATRDYKVEPWMKHQETEEWCWEDNHNVKTNKKLSYCRDVMALQNAYNKANGAERQRLAYRLAGYYVQASLIGDCWWLARYRTWGDNIKLPGDFNFTKQAMKLLDEALATEDEELKIKCLFAKSAISPVPAYQYDWSSENGRFVTLNKKSPQYKTLLALKDAMRNSAAVPGPISHCDMLKNAIKLLED